VSWAVLIFPYIDRNPTFAQWRKDWTQAGSGSGGGGSTPSGTGPIGITPGTGTINPPH
jgi:hypothetical protein